MLEIFQKVSAHDLSLVQDVSFVGSAPGTWYRDRGSAYTGPPIDGFGHLALLARLRESNMANLVKKTDTLVAQFSSIGSMGGKENKNWPQELATSMCGGEDVAGGMPPLSLVRNERHRTCVLFFLVFL